MGSMPNLGVDITSTLPGTPGGRFMRQFWTAVQRSEDLAPGHARPIRIMGPSAFISSC